MQSKQNPLNKTNFWSLVDKYDNFFFDCDGVLFNGRDYIQEAFVALNKLREMGKNTFFVTNMSRSTRKDVFDQISAGGFVPEMDKIFTSSYLAARYLSLNRPEIKKVYMVGGAGIKIELESEGITVVGGEEDENKPMDTELFDDLKVDEDVQAVIAGIDFGFNYYKLSYASILLQKGALFVATNPDSNVRMKVYKAPGGGSIVKAIEHSSGVSPVIVGKPNPTVIEVATRTFKLDPKRCLMIGDRLDTDILLGKNANIDTFAVLTGVSTEDEIILECTKENGILPTYYGPRVEVSFQDPTKVLTNGVAEK